MITMIKSNQMIKIIQKLDQDYISDQSHPNDLGDWNQCDQSINILKVIKYNHKYSF